MTADSSSPPTARAPQTVTPRAIALGLALVLVLVATNPYLAFIVDYWTVGSGAILNGPVAALFLLVLANGLVKRAWPARAFSRTELLFAYAIAIIPVGLAQAGGLPYITATTTLPVYMATPGNRWATLVLPHLPAWLQLSDPRYATWFWEGAPAGAGVPWSAWRQPMLGWGAFTFALMAALFCLGALLRRDWIEGQRLTFPTVDVPLAITGDAAVPSFRTSLLSNRLFWLGFAVPALYLIADWLNLIYPSFPAVRLHDIEVGRFFAGMPLPWSALSEVYVSIIFPIIGISFLVPTQVTFSLWLFYLLFQLHLLGWASFGVSPYGGGASSVQPYEFASFMEAGGAIALCGVILYRSRRAFVSAWRGLARRGREADDPYAAMSGRWALAGFVAANAFMLWWVSLGAMPWWSFALLIGLFYVGAICIAYLVASGGVMFVTFTASPSSVLLRTLGGGAFAPSSLALMLSLDSIYMREGGISSPLAQMLQASKLLHTARIRARRLGWATALAVVIAIGAGFAAILVTVQRHGAGTLDNWPWSWPNWSICQTLAANVQSPEEPDGFLRVALGLGGGVVLLLVWLQSRFVGWPLSPYGFIIASTYMTNRMMWASIFIGWAAATLVLRYGGLRLFRQLRPIALGLVLGYYLTKLPITVLSAVFGVTQRWGLFSY
jgi:hypothetical protein